MKSLTGRIRMAFSKQKRPAYDRSKAVHLILLLTVPTGLVFSAFNFLGGNTKLALIEGFVMLFILTPVFWLVKQDKYVELGENIVMLAAVAIFSLLYLTGGFGGAGSNWIYIYPFVAFYINDQQKAWKWVGFFLLLMLCNLSLASNGYITAYYELEKLDVFLVTFLFYTFLAYHFSSLRNQYDSRLETQVNEKTADLQKAMKELERHAKFDALTGLANRYSFETKLLETIRACAKKKCSLCVAVIDLDRFQEINNIMGHDKGDEVLRQVGQRLTGLIRDSDAIAHIGGYTFALLLRETDENNYTSLTQPIVEAMHEEFDIQGYAIELSMRIGVAFFPQHGSDSSILLQSADLAMRQAKTDLSDHPVIYDREQEPYSFRTLMLFGKLRKAISTNNLFLVYQPKINLDTLRITDVEALIRWQDEEEGFVSPAEFIPMAEQTGLITQISEWVYEEAARQAAIWKKAGYSIPIAVNLSPHNLLDPKWLQKTELLLERHDLNSSDISIEVTETAFMNRPDTVLAVLNSLNELGIKLSIDDFGTGYSSLSYMEKLPVNELKIDQCFVTKMIDNPRDKMIVELVIELAHGLDLKVVAEGVEDRDVLLKLKEMGVDKAQGFYMSRPQSPEDLQEWLLTSEWGIEAPKSE